MAERRTTRRRPQDDERPQDDDLAEEYDDELPSEADGQDGDAADAGDEPDVGDEADAGDEAGDDAAQNERVNRRPVARKRPRRTSGGRSGSDDRPGNHGRRASGGRRPGLTAAEVAQAGTQQIAELTGKRPETVTEVRPNGDNWTVGVEVIEDRRIPSSTDLMGLYEIDIDRSGDLLSYRRVRRYTRGRGDYGED